MIKEKLPLSESAGLFKGHMFNSEGPDYSTPEIHRSMALIFEGGVVYCTDCHGFLITEGTRLEVEGRVLQEDMQVLEINALYKVENSLWRNLVDEKIASAGVAVGMLEQTYETPETLKHYVIRSTESYLHVLCEEIVFGANLDEFNEFLPVQLLKSNMDA